MGSQQNYETLSFHPSLSSPQPCIMHKFRLYETRSNFYMIGRDKSRRYWRVLTISRSEPSELDLREDPTTYSEIECNDLIRRINEGNKCIGGLKFVTICYGIVGFIKFLGPYYMLLITKRREVGAICGHTIYAISKSELILLPNSTERANMPVCRNENRYKKLLCMVDLTKDFFYSYSYNVMRTLQKNLWDRETGQIVYETMFVWNEFLTRGIRNHLQNTRWTVALVYGFFRQDTLSVDGRYFSLTLIARRSRHYAGTRYLKRGVNEKGRVANDVETEQIVLEDIPEGSPVQISSIVQNRGSIPLFWSQETSRLNLKPDIILSKKDLNYEATRLHFENLAMRYGNPIIILNLIKTVERRPRESILRAEFANAIECINRDLPDEKRLKFLHWDLNKHSRSKANVLVLLGKLAAYALTLTGFFYCQLPASGTCESSSIPLTNAGTSSFSQQVDHEFSHEHVDVIERDTVDREASGDIAEKKTMFQNGVLRTNCIDCLDRTNVAQFAYGLAALGHQLHALDMVDIPRIDLDSPLANELMSIYENMGDTLAHQYGGSAAHNKIFSQRRGQWKAATQSQEFFRTLQRYYSNAYMDADKQNAINVFLGNFQPQSGKPSVWELGSDHDCDSRRNVQSEHKETERSSFKRCWSDGSILRESSSPISSSNMRRENFSNYVFPISSEDSNRLLVESSPDISASESDTSYCRYTKSMPRKQFFGDVQREQYVENNHVNIHERLDSLDCSNFVDLEWLSSSGNSCEEESYERSTFTSSPVAGLSSDNVMNGVLGTPSSSQFGSGMKGREPTDPELSCNKAGNSVLEEYSDNFVHWVTYGETLCQ
ncbi:phosphoinositide phosphatase SAC4-like [Silene latifolia]|uniref:phosphoinositide phosphatase SAC4-like n=1 Tax=Silene latifolia TaxID=37657 RepID=UPI003D7770C0